MIVFSIDPGTGVKSACGIAVLSVKPGQEPELLHIEDVWAIRPQPTTMMRIRDVVDQVEQLMTEWYEKSDGSFAVAIESFVMRGKGGETLQRFIGAVLTRVPTNKTKIIEVANTKMKKFVGGTGKADKELVLKKVLIKFPANDKLILAGIREQYDGIDAVGIGLTAIDLEGGNLWKTY